jgi:anti-sigma regulatory factor (Ser/Thr protein kinase)
MIKMPVISTDHELNDRVRRITDAFEEAVSPVFIESSEDALEYLKYELPEVSVLHYSDTAIDTQQILETIKADPWLLYGGLVAVHKSSDRERAAEQMPNSNIISLIPRSEFVSTFSRVLRIVVQNRQILFQREVQNELLGTISGSFVMDNDPFNVRTYANLVTNFLYNLNYVDEDQKDRLHVALFEMLMNAVEHGNCNISYTEKTEWLESGGDILKLIREKCEEPEVAAKHVYFSYRITPERSYYTIADEGEGFDWRSFTAERKPDDVNLGMHGHGIRMTKHYIENLQYNETGNEVSFELPHQQDRTNVVPELFSGEEEITFSDGETIFTEDEESNDLFYIVSGKLQIYSEGQLVSKLGPEDIFLGEMSFLLNDKRSATVLSEGTSTLLRISKNEFVNAVQERPHYGIFLARLLAQRIIRLNRVVSSLKGGEAHSV